MNSKHIIALLLITILSVVLSNPNPNPTPSPSPGGNLQTKRCLMRVWRGINEPSQHSPMECYRYGGTCCADNLMGTKFTGDPSFLSEGMVCRFCFSYINVVVGH